MNPLLCYVRARLQRRLFMWFGATILLTVVAVSWVLGATGNGEMGWRREVQRISAFVSGRFERVWDSPADRDELARAMSRDLDATVVLEGTDQAPLATFGPPAATPRCAWRSAATGRSSGTSRPAPIASATPTAGAWPSPCW